MLFTKQEPTFFQSIGFGALFGVRPNMHSHVLAQANTSSVLRRMVAEGVTRFRQMTGSAELLEERREGTLPIGTDAPSLLAMPGSLGPGSSIWIGYFIEQGVLLRDAAQHPTGKTPPITVPAFLEKMLMKHLKTRLINPAAFEGAAYTARLQRAFDTYSGAKCRALAKVFVANQTWNVPTLVRLRTQELADSSEY